MFEQWSKLKSKHGAKNVFDFSIGNPNLKPPKEFKDELKKLANNNDDEWFHQYMPNAGYSFVRESIAKYVSKEQEIPISKEQIIMTCGAAWALNTIFKAILNPWEEVLVPIPCFVEYKFYIDNHSGIFKSVQTNEDFSLDIEAIEKAINNKTRVLLINSPNNPTGHIYSKESLEKLGKLLNKKSRKFWNIIYLVSDEPYRKIVYDGVNVPSIFKSYSDSIIVTSYSKDLSIPGERIWFLAVNPNAKFCDKLINAMIFTNRILGYVNAPAIMQRVLVNIQGKSVDVLKYKQKRDLLCEGLLKFWYQFEIPKGTFYLFVKSPIKDDVKFVKILQDELILVVPWSWFMWPWYFRLSYCVDDSTIKNSFSGFKRAMDRCKN